MNSKDRKAFLGFQQGELNAVLMYRKFAEVTSNPKFKAAYLEAAKDEGRHAQIMAKYTGVKLKPKPLQANVLGVLYKILPKRLVHIGVSIGEYYGGTNYRPYNKEEYPEIKDMIEDEYKHGDIFRALAKQ